MANPAYPSLTDRVVIMTGGGRGLGKEMALALCEAGAKILITAARNPDELAEVEQAGGGRIVGCLADAAEPEDCQRTVSAALDAFGAVHCLVNNAGRGMRLISETFTTTPCRFWDTDPADWRQIIDCNVNGAFNMARAVTPHLLKQGFGKIINISTSAQTMVRTGYSPYGPSKAALEAMSRVWAEDLADTGVTVNVLLPGGATDTALLPDMPDRRGADGKLLSPALMRAPILWLCADDSNGRTAERYIARQWRPVERPQQAAAAARDDAGKLPRIL